jgi:hypothetical protein
VHIFNSKIALSCLQYLILFDFVLGPFYERLGRPVDVDQLGEEFLLHPQVVALAHHVQVEAKCQDVVHVGEFVEHDGGRATREEHAHKPTHDKHQRYVQTNDAATKTAKDSGY